MRERQDPILPLAAEPATVYRCGTGRRFLTRKAAYLAAARQAYKTANPCECEPDVGYDCGCGEELMAAEHKLIPRLARWLQWRDGRRAALGAR